MTRSCVVLLGDAARALRRSLGPVAWAVLEDLATEAQLNEHVCVVETNVRRVAGNVGISKDTAARALRRLINAGLVTRAPSRRGERGEFATISYEIHLDRTAGITTAAPSSETTTIADAHILRETPTPARRRPRDIDAAQVSLFDEATG